MAEATSPARSLTWLLLGLSGQALTLQTRPSVDGAGPAPRSVLTQSHLLLPAQALSSSEGRCAIAHAAAHLLFSPLGSPAGKLKPMSMAVMSAIEDARAERLFMKRFPGTRQWFLAALRGSVQRDKLSCESLVSRMDLALMDDRYNDDNHWVNKARQLFEAQADRDLGDYDAFRRIGSLLANDLGQMRVPFRPELYCVPAPYRDDNSCLWIYEDQRAQPKPEIALSAAASLPLSANDSTRKQPADNSELARWSYPEWEHRTEVLRRDWCTVVDRRPAWGLQQPNSASPVLLRGAAPLRLIHARRLNRAHRLHRQWEGDELDLNAAVDVMVAQRAHLPVDARLFIRVASEQRACSVLVLLDMSESTNDRPNPGSTCLLDVEKSAGLLLARALQGSADRLAIFGFSSNTRFEVNNYRLLEFGQPLDGAVQALVTSAPGRYSTRIGAAIRHATQALICETTASRILLVVTDGAPSDVDIHDTRYLVEDARHAVHTARDAGLVVHGLAVDPHADSAPKNYVRRIFGWGHYSVVDNASDLPSRLCHLYARLSDA